jgi:hypothetical protein
MALRLVLSDGGLKLEPREQLQQLGENAGYSFHGGGLLRWLFVLARAMPTYQSARRLLHALIWTSLIFLPFRNCASFRSRHNLFSQPSAFTP